MAVDQNLIAACRELKARKPKFSDDDLLESMIDKGYDEDDIQAALAEMNKKPAPSDDACRNLQKDYGAPFRFVALNDKVIAANADETTPLDMPLDDAYCGDITVEWIAETPLLIGSAETQNGSVEPLAFDGKPVVPGASLRGMLRAALEIVAFGRLYRINAHYRYGFRDFNHPHYKAVTLVKGLKAGWLRKDPAGHYTLTPCRWSQVKIDDLVNIKEIPQNKEDIQWINKKIENKYDLYEMLIEKKTNKIPIYFYDFLKEHEIEAFDPTVIASDKENGHGRLLRGTLVFADKVPGSNGNKKYEYLFHGTTQDSIRLDENAMRTFQLIHCKPAKRKLEPDGSWKKLKPTIDAGGRIPVFYVGTPNEKDFGMGLTRLFKIPHARAVGDLRPTALTVRPRAAFSSDADKTLKITGTDFVETLFGYVLEDDGFDGDADVKKSVTSLARKGKVAFSFGTFTTKVKVQDQPTETVMMGPRASFGPFYLQGETKDYSDPNAQLAGRKRYFPRYDQKNLRDAQDRIQAFLRSQTTDKNGKKLSNTVITKLKFLIPAEGREMRFTSTLRLHNATPAEVGALLWVITHGNPDTNRTARHLLGRAKPFGAGQVRVGTIALDRLRPNFPTSRVPDLAAFLKAFENRMSKAFEKCMGSPTWRDSEPVQEFLRCAEPGHIFGKNGYMDLKEFTQLKRHPDLDKTRRVLKPLPQNAGPGVRPK